MIEYLSHNLARLTNWKPSVPQRYIAFVSMNGVLFAVLNFGEVIARKSLGASGLEVTFLSMTMPVASLTSIWWARLLVGRDQGKFLIRFGIFAYLALLTGFFLQNIMHLISVFLCFFIINALFIPADNRILQQHIPAKSTGRLYGMAVGLRLGIAALVSAGLGWYMDVQEEGFKHIFILAALTGFVATVIMSSIRTGYVQGADPVPLNRKLLIEPWRKAIQLLKVRKDYLRFEVAFMLYGIAFMMTLPVVPLYLVDDLKLSYVEIGLAKGTVTQLIMIFSVPLFGRIFDRTTPHKLASVVFLFLSGFPVLLLLAGMFEGNLRSILIYVSFAHFGFSMSGIFMIWGLSSLRFARGEDAGVYHSVHVAATGVRGLFAPLLGYMVMSTMGKTTALLTSSALLIVGSLMMILVRWWDKKVGEDLPLEAD